MRSTRTFAPATGRCAKIRGIAFGRALIAAAVILSAGNALAKGSATAGGGASAASAHDISPSAPGTNGSAGNLFQTFNAATFPSQAFDPALFPNPAVGGPIYPPMPAWGVYAAPCLTAVSGLAGIVGDETRSRADADRVISEEAIDHIKPYYPVGIDEATGRRYGSGVSSIWRSDNKGCEKFIDKDGKIGPWGTFALEQMKDDQQKNVFDSKVPSDISQFCPEFSGMSPARKEYFWLWFLATLAKPESSCRATAINHDAPNGNAIGLFQLEPDKCYPMSSSDLEDPYQNIRCAVKMLGHELDCRGTMMIDTSHGHCGTYWGELRTNPFGPDKGAAASAKIMLASYPDCQKTNATSTVPHDSAAGPAVRAPATK